MAAWITAAVLAWLCLVLILVLIGRDWAARKRGAALTRAADEIAEKYAAEQVKVRHLRKRNEQLRDELDIATGAVEPSLVAEMTAFLATAKPEDFSR